jgi:large subunit ribosomal protein L21e
MKSSGGFRSGTRRKLASGKRAKFSVEKYMQEFRPDQRVVIKHDPSSHSGMPHPRFKGLTGVVSGKRGNAYIVKVRVGKKEKEIVARPEHLKRLSE